MTARAKPLRPGAVARAIEAWFAANARVLPWRVRPRDPYLSLVSEFMLQQTQVARVVPRFERFVERFPGFDDLAGAPEQDVLALWSGLGYYRRARLLHRAARAVVERHGGVLPTDAAGLRALPGVGRYTAGALMSIVHGRSEPIVDANVARVLLRLCARRAGVAAPATAPWAWRKAAELVGASAAPGTLNEGLMELGAVVCTPRAPRCEACPLARHCAARAAGLQDAIPTPARPGPKRTLSIECVVVTDRRGRVLLQQRPAAGMWSSMWQVPTLEHEGTPPPAATARRRLARWLAAGRLAAVEEFTHGTSHRDVRVRVWRALAPRRGAAPDGTSWTAPEAAQGLALSNLQRRVLRHAAPAAAAQVS